MDFKNELAIKAGKTAASACDGSRDKTLKRNGIRYSFSLSCNAKQPHMME